MSVELSSPRANGVALLALWPGKHPTENPNSVIWVTCYNDLVVMVVQMRERPVVERGSGSKHLCTGLSALCWRLFRPQPADCTRSGACPITA